MSDLKQRIADIIDSDPYDPDDYPPYWRAHANALAEKIVAELQPDTTDAEKLRHIRGEVSWVEKRGCRAHQAAMDRIRRILGGEQ